MIQELRVGGCWENKKDFSKMTFRISFDVDVIMD